MFLINGCLKNLIWINLLLIQMIWCLIWCLKSLFLINYIFCSFGFFICFSLYFIFFQSWTLLHIRCLRSWPPLWKLSLFVIIREKLLKIDFKLTFILFAIFSITAHCIKIVPHFLLLTFFISLFINVYIYNIYYIM